MRSITSTLEAAHDLIRTKVEERILRKGQFDISLISTCSENEAASRCRWVGKVPVNHVHKKTAWSITEALQRWLYFSGIRENIFLLPKHEKR